jgi:hypothetical protein
VVSEEATAVLFVKNTGVSPLVVGERTEIEYIDNEHVARFSAFNPKRPTQVVVWVQLHVPDIVRTVVVGELPTGPIEAFDSNFLARLHRGCRRNIRMPPVDNWVGLFLWRCFSVHFEYCLWHDAC